MEPLIDEMDSSENLNKAQDGVWRIKIGKAEADKLGAIVQQAQDSSKGFVGLTKSDVVNFLIREQKAELTHKQMQQLRTQFYDPIKHMNWIMLSLREALANGDMKAVAVLQSEIKGIEISVVSPEGTKGSVEGEAKAPPPRRKRRSKAEAAMGAELTPEKDTS